MSRELLLVISEAKLVAHGSQRIVYLHPEDESKVLKVFRDDRPPAYRAAKRWYGQLIPLRRFDDNERDYRQYRRVAKKAAQPPRCISTIFGFAETTRGRALVAEHVVNADGRSSESLKTYVQRHGLGRIFPLLDDFFEALAVNHVVARDPHWKNILVREGDSGPLELVIIDGLGDPNFPPRATMFRQINRRKLMRKKEKLIRKLRALEKQQMRPTLDDQGPP